MEKKSILFLFVLFISNIYSQQNLSKKEVESNYRIYQVFTKETDFLFKKEKFNEKDYFKKGLNKNEIENFIGEFEKSAKLEIFKTFDKNGLNLTATFSGNLKDVGYENVTMKLINCKLLDKNNDSIKIKHDNFTTFTPIKINHRCTLIKDTISEKLFDNFHGETTYSISFLTGYDKIILDRTNIGNIIELGGSKYKIIDYRYNKLIIEKLSGKEDNLKLINFSSDGTVIKSYSASDFYKMQKDNPSLKNKVNFNNSKLSGFPISLYDCLKSPKMTIDEFEKYLNSYIPNQSAEKREIFHITSIIAPNSKFILYCPKYETRIIKFKK